ncbi:hypothetical protein Fmac_027641 [Flemingia macrophylla]|uniref:Uncharacterized protein n=1 Tax=Flemingia macrophylla TaxID=520843 RepID=A0ABD1LIA4_9FABA
MLLNSSYLAWITFRSSLPAETSSIMNGTDLFNYTYLSCCACWSRNISSNGIHKLFGGFVFAYLVCLAPCMPFVDPITMVMALINGV